MKKIIIAMYVGLLFSSSITLPMEPVKKTAAVKKIEFTKKDYIKTGIALLGSGLCAAVALKTLTLLMKIDTANRRDLDKHLKNKTWSSWERNSFTYESPVPKCSLAEALVAMPFWWLLPEIAQWKHLENAYLAQVAFSWLFSGALGIYTCKKLYQFKKARSFNNSQEAV